ncbi:MAG TPA: TlpA disulfide reductase family protein [Candidatus Omnitrophota bacterium]|nr:TlpA disulfide reductase family protein [Candidatus Omnitrophota bacterium]
MRFSRSLVISCLLFFSVLGASHAMGQLFMFENPLVGEKAPDFTLKTADGKELNLSKFRNNQNTLVFFWATWCPHCREQLQELTAAKGKQMQDKGIKILLVDIEETVKEVAPYIKKYKVPFEVVIDEDSSISEKYNIVGVPTFFFIDKNGVVQTVEHEIPADYEKSFGTNAKK